MIADRVAAVRERIAQAADRASRPPGDITLVAVSKTFPAESVRAAFAAGVRHFGENRVQEASAKIDALAGCHIVYCQAVGASAIAQLRNAGIQPIKVTPGTAIKGLVRDLQRELRDGPSSWLSRAMALQAPRDADRFDTMAAEGWSE